MNCIGVFDSGVGGLSVLKALRARLPHTALLYVADSGHAPYGERGAQFVIERSQRIVAHLLGEGAAGVVVACNTATAAAVHVLRQAWPELPFVGVEPALKPAAAMTRNGRVGVMATPGTLASEKFAALLRAQPATLHVELRPCPGLAHLIEAGDLDAHALVASIEAHAAALRAAMVDTVVLGCTHYSFVRHHIEAALGPGVQVIDTAEPVSRHAARLFAKRVTAEPDAPVRLRTTGDVVRLREIASAWLPFACDVQAASPTLHRL
ncbi:glutamate racemase [Piscinibacter sp. XHJ-5]|uniref:glutamate racemase n=1 Tax=Piscinibacter sp. XHJ-5 TaxID=3037797 RepID=UPI0024531A89|nr:glutamate racemase [Piscinibacter sp. XHJ-5]